MYQKKIKSPLAISRCVPYGQKLYSADFDSRKWLHLPGQDKMIDSPSLVQQGNADQGSNYNVQCRATQAKYRPTYNLNSITQKWPPSQKTSLGAL